METGKEIKQRLFTYFLSTPQFQMTQKEAFSLKQRMRIYHKNMSFTSSIVTINVNNFSFLFHKYEFGM